MFIHFESPGIFLAIMQNWLPNFENLKSAGKPNATGQEITKLVHFTRASATSRHTALRVFRFKVNPTVRFFIGLTQGAYR